MRVCTYLPDALVKLLSEEYSLDSPGQVLRQFVLEVLSERRRPQSFRHYAELRALALAELVKEELSGDEK